MTVSKAERGAMNSYRDYACDLCGSAAAAPIASAPFYTNGQAINVCRQCGFVYVPRRRPAKAIADVWSDELFQNEGDMSVTSYSARVPAIKARQLFVAETIDTELGLKGKSLCDIGAGEGQFLAMVKDEYGGRPYGIEPSRRLCAKLTAGGLENFCGAIEDYVEAGQTKKETFDVVTMMWTLECSSAPRDMLKTARDLLKDGGHVVVATGSRVLVPFKKPLQFYLSPQPVDTHCLRFSANSLRAILTVCGFRITFINRYIDQDWLVVIGEKSDDVDVTKWQGNSFADVLDFFERWHQESQKHYANYVDT